MHNSVSKNIRECAASIFFFLDYSIASLISAWPHFMPNSVSSLSIYLLQDWYLSSVSQTDISFPPIPQYSSLIGAGCFFRTWTTD